MMIRRPRPKSRADWHSFHESARTAFRRVPFSLRADMPTWSSHMRTLGFRTHVLLVLAGAVGVLASLDRPWYGPAPKPLPDNGDSFDVHGPLYGLIDAIQRWVS